MVPMPDLHEILILIPRNENIYPLTHLGACARTEKWYAKYATYAKFAKPNLPNQTYQIKPAKSNLPNQTFQIKPAKSNLPNQTF